MNDHGWLHAAGIWFLVGLSKMTPLEFVQMFAALFASIYSLLLIVDWCRKKWRRDANDR